MNDSYHRRAEDEMDHSHQRRADPTLTQIAETMRTIATGMARMETSVHDQIEKLEAGQSQLTQHVYKLSVRLEAVETKHEETTGFLQNHARVEEEVLAQQVEQIDAVGAKLTEIMRGFPRDPDDGERKPAYHADWHERDIRKAKDWADVVKDVRKWAIIGLLSALFGVMGTLLVTGALESMKQAVNGKQEQTEKKK